MKNLLRDGDQIASLPLTAEIGTASANLTSQPVLGDIWDPVTVRGSRVILNFVNFTKANSMAWRDKYGTQSPPDTISGITLGFPSTTRIRQIWTASPDFYGGSPVELPFSQSGGTVSFTLPRLLYWSMVVVQLDTEITAVNPTAKTPRGFAQTKFPNPFNPTTRISYSLSDAGWITLKVYDVLGREVGTLVNGREGAGSHSVTFDASSLPSGVYIYRLDAGGYSSIRKMMLLK